MAGIGADTAVVTGSGMDPAGLLDHVRAEVPFSEVPGLAPPGVPGHAGRFLFGDCAGRPLVVQSGRVHLYEGHGPEMVARAVEALRGWGVRRILFLTAAGGLGAGLRPGELVAVCEVWPWPSLRHGFPPLLRPALVPDGCDHEGAYAWMAGPNYETRAEIAALRRSGALVVGMSLPAELAACARLGVESAAVACVANLCGAPEKLTHTGVVAVMERASARLPRWLRETPPWGRG